VIEVRLKFNSAPSLLHPPSLLDLSRCKLGLGINIFFFFVRLGYFRSTGCRWMKGRNVFFFRAHMTLGVILVLAGLGLLYIPDSPVLYELAAGFVRSGRIRRTD